MGNNIVNLTEICNFQGGSQPPKDEWIDHEAPGYIRMLQIRDFTQAEKDNAEYVKESKTLKKCNTDDILIGRYGASVGKILTGLSGAYNVALIKTLPDETKIFKRYLYYYLNSPYFQNLILTVGSRAAQAGFNKEDLNSAVISLPALEDQRRIAALLDKVSDLIAKRQAQLDKLDLLVKARFVEMFGDPVANSLGWRQITLHEVANKIGSGATPKGGKESYQAEGITLIRSMNVYDAQFVYKDLAHITNGQAAQLDNVSVEKNDVLINITGASVARCCITPYEVLPARVNQHVAIIRCIPDQLHPTFINYMLINDSFKKKLLAMGEAGGATRQAITKQQLDTLEIILPPLERQKQFATFVEQTGKSKLTIQQNLDKLEILKKSLMQQYFG